MRLKRTHICLVPGLGSSSGVVLRNKLRVRSRLSEIVRPGDVHQCVQPRGRATLGINVFHLKGGLRYASMCSTSREGYARHQCVPPQGRATLGLQPGLMKHGNSPLEVGDL